MLRVFAYSTSSIFKDFRSLGGIKGIVGKAWRRGTQLTLMDPVISSCYNSNGHGSHTAGVKEASYRRI